MDSVFFGGETILMGLVVLLNHSSESHDGKREKKFPKGAIYSAGQECTDFAGVRVCN